MDKSKMREQEYINNVPDYDADLENQKISKISDKVSDTFWETITDYIHIYFDDLSEDETERVYSLILKDIKENYFDKIEL
jgi:DNA-binding protein Fis|tara:strand:+ start:862 stop:1101 length:240 start_codon:yes stop_codon:yes gene_type:complete